jgi:hypothetical protein
MSLNAKRISIFITDVPAGQHLFTITNARNHKKSNGELITYEGNPGVILSYSSEGLVHEEIYWVNGYNYSRLRKLLAQLGLDPAGEIIKKDLIGKQFWGEIMEYKYMRGVQEVKSEKHLINTWEKEKGYNDSPKEYVIYKEDTFNQEDSPAF